MSRATKAAILKLMPDDCSSFDFDTAILQASKLVNFLKLSEQKLDGVVVHDEESLTLIENWLAAHFHSIANPLTVNESASGGSASFERPTLGGFLESSSFGQAAIMADFSGRLDAYNIDMKKGNNKKVKARIWTQ